MSPLNNMNPIRTIISEYFQAPMQQMSFPAYFQYSAINQKMTERIRQDLLIVLLSAVDEMEKTHRHYEDNFREIEEILTKLVQKQQQKEASVEELKAALQVLPKIAQTQAVSGDTTHVGPYICSVCQKSFTHKIALIAHSRIHAVKKDPSVALSEK